MQAVPFSDLTSVLAPYREELNQAVCRVLESGRFVLGPEIEAFESEFARYCGATHCVGVGNGLDALSLILQALDIGPGDEVVVPAHTFIATWLAVSRLGATPVPVDVTEDGFNIDSGQIEAAISPRTRAIVVVHLYGQPVDMQPVLRLAKARGLYVVEDAAQAHGARYYGCPVGACGDAAAFSFYPGKNLGAAGDGGAVTTSDARIAERVRKLRNYGSSTKYHHEVHGMNSRLDEVQAAWLRVRLQHLDEENAMRRHTVLRYRHRLAGLNLMFPEAPTGVESVWHLLVIRHVERDLLQQTLRAKGIEALIHYPIPCHKQRAYEGRAWPVLPGAESLAREVLSLPMWAGMTDETVDRVADAVIGFTAVAHRA